MSGLHAAMAATLLRRAVLEVKGDLRDVTRRHVDAMMRRADGTCGQVPGPARRPLLLGGLLPGDAAAEGGRSGSPAAPGRPPRDRRPRRDRAGGLDGHGPAPSTSSPPQARPRLRPEPSPGSTPPTWAATASACGFGCARAGTATASIPWACPSPRSSRTSWSTPRYPAPGGTAYPCLVAPKGIAWVVGWRIAEWAKVRDSDPRRLQVRFRRT